MKPNRTQMLIEALEYYIQDLKDHNCTEAFIEAYTNLLNEIEQNET